MRRVVRGAWGPREESVETLAGRWKLTLERLTGLLPTVVSGPGEVGTWRHIRESEPFINFQPDEASLRGVLRDTREADGWTDRTGTRLTLASAGETGWNAELRGRGGGTSEFLLQTMMIAIESPDDAEIPDVELLTVLAEVWAPDFGDVSNDDVLDALEDEGGFGPDEPSVGWVGYLSPGRAALVPDGMTAPRKELGVGGILLEIAPYGNIESVLQANLRLRDSGALQPLPRPMERTAL
ncbi:hypothetical protein [Streptomyces sp. NPDC002133]|uniref:hypothetical protein n=1 Tax=Streptomyces sp. NPDC002133 TaxID=3154409 RepID=UPI003323B303